MSQASDEMLAMQVRAALKRFVRPCLVAGLPAADGRIRVAGFVRSPFAPANRQSAWVRMAAGDRD